MADIPKLAPPPQVQRGQQQSVVAPDDVDVQLQVMGLAGADAQKPLPDDLVAWGPEPDDLDAELAMVEKELAQLNTLDLSLGAAEAEVGQAEGDYEVWKAEQEKALTEFDPFPDYTRFPDPVMPPQNPAGQEVRFSSYGALASNTAALKFNQPSETTGQSAWLEFESPFAGGAPAAQQQGVPQPDGAVPKGTLRAVFQFIPRHSDELAMNVGDPITVESKAPDLWCLGQNMRTGQTGIFPGHCVSAAPGGGGPSSIVSRPLSGGGGGGQPTRKRRAAKFRLRFVGAVPVKKHAGVELLCAAISKVHNWRRKSNIGPLKPVILEITVQGIRMTDISERDARYQEERRQSVRMGRGTDQVADAAQKQFFFPLVNVTFCSCHPNNSRLWAFIVKRKDRQFTCQVFVASQSTQPLTVALGRTFKQLHASYMSHAHPTQDFYQE